MHKLCLGLSFAAMALLIACGSEESSSSSSLASGDASVYNDTANTLTDQRDGQVYRTVVIAPAGSGYSEVWMAENLNFVTERSWCGGGEGDTYIEGDCSVYGRLYTWAAAVAKPEDECGYGYECDLGAGDIRGVCPKGWHLPSEDEWDELITAVGGEAVAGKMLKSKTGWNSFSGIENNDTYLFSVLPAGYRCGGGYDDKGTFGDGGREANFWSSTENGSDGASNVSLKYNDDLVHQYGTVKDDAFSVRCLKD